MIDFGLSKKFRDPQTLQHIAFSDGKSLTGTARYASISALRGFEQSRRDDLEALGYVFVYLLKGSLPWMGLAVKDRGRKYEKILQVKERTTLLTLCRGLPEEFIEYFQIVRALKFQEEPDYLELKNLMRSTFLRKGYVYDYQYDWSIDQNKALKSNRLNGSSRMASNVREQEPVQIIPKTKILKARVNSANKTIKKSSFIQPRPSSVLKETGLGKYELKTGYRHPSPKNIEFSTKRLFSPYSITNTASRLASNPL